MFLSLVLQNMIFTQVRLFGVHPMVLPSVCVAVGMFLGSTWGAAFALVMGIFADMAFVENTLLFTLLFPAIAFFSGFVCQFFVNRRFFAFMGLSRFFAFMGLSLVAAFGTAVVQMVATFLGDAWSPVMLKTVILQTLWSLPPAVLAYFPPAHWIS